MSGIVGIMNLDGRPVDRRLLRRMTSFMGDRGPDAENIWAAQSVGFGHTLLRTAVEDENEHQPCSLDGQVWITADFRLDGRHGLMEKLRSHGQRVFEKCTDVELILHAYRTWGTDLVRHLLGDFSFALWDDARRTLFCARDHFGVKPFFYALNARRFVFSNTLNCLRMLPEISSELNDPAIADFLLQGYNADLHTTAFRDIQRLAPAHTLTVSFHRPLSCRRYWQLPAEKMIHYKRKEDYLDHFRGLLNQAVGDRLRSNRVGILMSGGLDSTAVAAAAHTLLSERFGRFELRAATFTYSRLIHDDEPYYSRAAARAIGIPIRHLPQDDEKDDENWFESQPVTPEPLGAYMITRTTGPLRQMAAGFRIALTGQGGDPALDPAPLNLGRFFKDLIFEKVAIDMFKYYLGCGRLPRLGLRTRMRRRLKKRNWTVAGGYPPWLNKSLETRLRLADRWNDLNHDTPAGDTLRAQAYRFISAPVWTCHFENYDPGVTGFQTELRHPFFDLRLLAFLLALPPVPWCVDKQLLRSAMRGKLPEEILCRPKSPLAGCPQHQRLRKTPLPDLGSLVETPELDRFINIDRYLRISRRPEKLRPEESGLITRPLGLAVWLKQGKGDHRRQTKEASYVIN